MTYQAKFTKEQREYAKEKGLALACVSIDGHGADVLTGRYEIAGPMPIEKVRLLFLFGCALSNGEDPRKAFAKGLKVMKQKQPKKLKSK